MDAQFFESLPIGILVCDEKGRIIECNNRLAEIFGYAEKELCGKSLELLVPEALRADHETMVRRFFENPSSKQMDGGRILTGLHKSGHTVSLNIGLSFRRTESGIQAIASVLDATARLEAEQKAERRHKILRTIQELSLHHLQNPESTEIYRQMLEAFLEFTESPIGFIGEVRNNSQAIQIRAASDISWNDWSREWLAGVESGDALFEQMDSLYGSVIKTGAPVIANDAQLDSRSHGIPDGHMPIERFLGIPLRYRGRTIAVAGAANSAVPYDQSLLDEISGLSEVMASIAAGKRLHRDRAMTYEAMQRQERQFRSLVENSKDLIGVFSLERRLVYSTPAQKQVLGYAHDDLSLTDSMDFVHPEDQPKMERLLTRLLEGEPIPEQVRYRYRHKDGTYRILESRIRVDRDIASEPVFVINARDVTELDYYQNSLLRTVANLQSESAAKNRFMAKLSHEIRTPLNAILGLTDLLMRQSMNPEHERLIEVIHSSGDTLLRLLNDLLEATQLQGDELNLRIAPVDLRHVLETTLLGYQYHARRSNTQLQYTISQDLPARVLGDAGRLKQIITNIVSNAIKYAAGGSIEVTLSRIPARQDDHCRLLLLVSDNGPGIPASEQDSIFQIFSRVNNPGDDLVPGVGLGLYIVKQLVDKMDGCITVRSPSGMGTPERPGTDFLVELEFKVIAEEAEGAVQRPVTYEFGDRPRILVAEDNPANQILIGRMLEEMRCEVTLVDNGEEATREARNGKYDLIILDINMPLLGGFEASRIIRSYNSEVPIVALSAAAENPPEEKLYSCGMSRYLVKPVWQADLFATIRELTGKN